MFWKKKNKDKRESGHISNDPSDLRDSFRVKPSLADPVFLEIDGKFLQISNISSGGISFINDGFKVNDAYWVKFVLPYDDVEIKAELKVIRIEENICHTQFFNIPVEMEDHIHDYVLYRQKEDIQSGKRYT